MTLTVSLVTPTYNSAATIARCLSSVDSQTHPRIEHIVVDGASTDNTLEIVRSAPHVSRVVSEPDDNMYQALNRGLALATGDVVGTLNSDDAYADTGAIGRVVAAFEDGVEATIGDIAVVDEGRVIRRYGSRRWAPWQFRLGLMPPHPAFFVRRRWYAELGDHREDLRIAADYELLARFLSVHRLPHRHVPGTLVHMQPAGLSDSGRLSRTTINREVTQVSADLGIDLVPGWKLIKYLQKATQLRGRR